MQHKGIREFRDFSETHGNTDQWREAKGSTPASSVRDMQGTRRDTRLVLQGHQDQYREVRQENDKQQFFGNSLQKKFQISWKVKIVTLMSVD